MAQSATSQMGLADIVAAAWGICVRNAGLLLVISLASAVVAGIVNQAVLSAQPDVPPGERLTSDQIRDLVVSATPFLLIGLVFQVFTHVSLVRALLRLLRSERASLAEAFAAGLRGLAAALVAMVIVGALCGLLAATLLLVPLALFYFVNYLFFTQAIVDERAGPLSAMRRSRQLVRGQWWRTCGVGLAVFLLALLPTFVSTWVTAGFGSDGVASAGAGLATLVAAPFLAAGHTLLYLDIRRRKGEPLVPVPPPERVQL